MAVGSRLTTRPLGSEEVAFAAAAVEAVQPHHPWHADELLSAWRTHDRMGRARRLAIERNGRSAGLLSASMPDAASEGQGLVMVFLPAAVHGELDQAWSLAEGAGRELGFHLARTMVWADDAATLAVLEQRGWERKRRKRFWRLELSGQRERLAALRDAARRRVESAGLEITTAAELGGEAIYPELHRLDDVTSADEPQDVPHVPVPYDVWLGWMQPPAVLPERLWVATSAGRPVALSYLDYRRTPVSTGFTGVLREHRGAGVARALKLETLVQAIELAVDAVETDNDFENAPILHLNEEIGYREIVGRLTLHKRLAGSDAVAGHIRVGPQKLGTTEDTSDVSTHPGDIAILQSVRFAGMVPDVD